MKTLTFAKGKTACTAAAIAFTFAATLSTQAAVVTWGAASNITGDSNVSTVGTLVGAFNVGDGGVSAATVNGVNFNPFALNSTGGPVSTGTVGNFTLATTDLFLSDNTLYGSAVAPFTSLSAGYRTLLSSATTTSTPFTFSLTMNNLKTGILYQFEWFANTSGLGNQQHSASAGGTVVLNDNTTAVDGGLGQFAVGSFVADSSSQVITFAPVGAGPQFAQLNAFQLRVVPESASLLFGLGLIPLIVVVEMRRKRRATETPTS